VIGDVLADAGVVLWLMLLLGAVLRFSRRIR
jgi:hypothetical protein